MIDNLRELKESGRFPEINRHIPYTQFVGLEIVEIGGEMGAYNAAESGEDIRQCTALEINRVRQRLAVQIWRDYQEHITARIRYADPDADARTRLAEEMEQEEEEAEQALVRLYNEAYLQRMGRPQEFGV